MSKRRVFDGNNHFRRYFETTGVNAIDELALSTREGDIWVYDAPKSRDRRLKIYPEYKLKRNKPTDAFWEVFSLWKEVSQFLPIVSFMVPTYEADDVIFNLLKDTNVPTEIESTDADYRLIPNPLLSFTSKELPCEPKYVKLYKTLVGDTSDNIKGIPKYGIKAWEKLPDPSKDYFIEKFNLGEVPDYRLLNVGDKLTETAKSEHEMLMKYWQILDFFEISQEEIFKNMRVGKKDYKSIADIYEKEGIVSFTKWRELA